MKKFIVAAAVVIASAPIVAFTSANHSNTNKDVEKSITNYELKTGITLSGNHKMDLSQADGE